MRTFILSPPLEDTVVSGQQGTTIPTWVVWFATASPGQSFDAPFQTAAEALCATRSNARLNIPTIIFFI